MINQHKRPRLALTMGDPAGIGTEVILKALADEAITKNCDLVVVGSRDLLNRSYKNLTENTDNLLTLANPAELSVIDVPHSGEIMIGVGNAVSGAASFDYMEYAISHTLAGEFDGIVTGPIAKSAWKLAGYDYPGQTELLAEKAGVDRFGMLFVGRSPFTGWILRALLATTHIPLSQVSQSLTPELLTKKLDLLEECLQRDFGIKNGRIAIAGLNPHSGEMGQLGREEVDWLLPWLEVERQKRPHLHLTGPIPPDTMWVKPGQAWFGNSQVENSQVGNSQVENSQVGNFQVGNSQVGNSQVGNSQVGNSQVENPQVENPQVGNSQVGNSQVGNSQVGNSQVGNSQVENSQVENSQVGNSQVGNSQVGNSQVGNSQVGNSQVGNSQVGNSQVENPQVGNSQVGNSQVGNSQVGNSQVGNSQVENPQVGNPQVGNSQVGNSQVENPQVGNSQVGNSQVENPQVENSQVGNSQVGNSQVENPQVGNSQVENSQSQNPADAYLALYHDQGLIAVKLMAFDRAVNTTIGLPFVRTSPDHGTAFDIAGKGIADATSMKAAIELAVELVRQRLG